MLPYDSIFCKPTTDVVIKQGTGHQITEHNPGG